MNFSLSDFKIRFLFAFGITICSGAANISGATSDSHRGRSTTEIIKLKKKTQSFFEFAFILLNNLKPVELINTFLFLCKILILCQFGLCRPGRPHKSSNAPTLRPWPYLIYCKDGLVNEVV